MTFLKKNKTLLHLTLGLFLFFFLFSLTLPLIVAADTANPINAYDFATTLLNSTAQEAKLTNQNVTSPSIYAIIGEIINIVLGFLGVVFLVLVIFGGIMWMTAGGNEEKVKKASTLISQSAIGLAIVLFAFLITNFVIFRIINIANPSPNNTNSM